MLKVNLADEENNKKDENKDSSSDSLESAGKPLGEELGQPVEPSEAEELLSDDDTTIELDEIIVDEESVLPSDEITDEDLLGAPLGDDKEAEEIEETDSPTIDDDTTVSMESSASVEGAGSLAEPAKSSDLSDISIPPGPETPELSKEPVVQPKKEPVSSDDYYESDYDVGTGKKKWIFIGGGLLIVILIVVFFVLKPFGGESDVAIDEPQIDPIQARLIAKKMADAALMGKVRGILGGQIAPVISFIDQVPKTAKLSMLYIYGNDIEIQIFSKDRTAFAELRKNLKTAKIFDDYKLKDTRTLIPNADVLATYTIVSQPINIIPGDSAIFLNNSQVLSQLEAFAGRENIKIKTQSAVGSVSTTQDYKSSRMAFSLKGQEKNVINFINSITKSPLNVDIAKLSIAGISKNNVKKREMTGILELNLIMPN